MTHIPSLSLATALALALAAPALAQSSPQIRSMPMPPSATDAAPKESGASVRPSTPAKKPAARAKATSVEDGLEAPPANRTARARSGAAAGSGESFQRPKRFVPEEFDRGAEDDGGRAKPFVSESGRPGMGVRF